VSSVLMFWWFTGSNACHGSVFVALHNGPGSPTGDHLLHGHHVHVCICTHAWGHVEAVAPSG
jgi:hypothetical protein